MVYEDQLIGGCWYETMYVFFLIHMCMYSLLNEQWSKGYEPPLSLNDAAPLALSLELRSGDVGRRLNSFTPIFFVRYTDIICVYTIV